MKRAALAAVILLAAAALSLACGDDDGGNGGVIGSTEPGPDFLLEDVEAMVRTQVQRMTSAMESNDPAAMTDADLRELLPAMVLQARDVPEALQQLGGSFSTNTDAAGAGLGGGPSKEQLDEWGRILGYGTDFQRTEPPGGANVTAVSTSVSVYEAEEGATESFDDRVERARAADWQTSYSDLQQFEQRELTPDLPVDGVFWLRLSGFQQTAPGTLAFVTDDQIAFRIGKAWGFVRAISTGPAG